MNTEGHAATIAVSITNSCIEDIHVHRRIDDYEPPLHPDIDALFSTIDNLETGRKNSESANESLRPQKAIISIPPLRAAPSGWWSKFCSGSTIWG